jgi:hypothetical protein
LKVFLLEKKNTTRIKRSRQRKNAKEQNNNI